MDAAENWSFPAGASDPFVRALAGGLAAGLAAAGLSVSAGGVFLAAVSGGADSTALALGLAALAGTSRREGAGFAVRCLHVNHNIRDAGECSGDEEAVAALCSGLFLPLAVHRVPPGAIRDYAARRGTGLEAAARRFRYAALRKEARRAGASAILTAHTRDDLLETALMAFLRGSGPAGLGAMSGRPPASGAQIPVVRPMLRLGRGDALAWLGRRGIPYRDDPSNADTRFLRSRVRAALVPLLDREFPHWRGPVLRLNETQALTAAFLADEAALRIPWSGTVEDGELSTGADNFFAQNAVIREEALFRAMDALGVSGGGAAAQIRPGRAALRSFAGGTKSACDLEGFRLENRGGNVTVGTVAKRKGGPDAFSAGGFSVLIKSPGFYKLDVKRPLICESVPEEYGESRGFYAALPLALRSGVPAARARFIEALDKKGRAAFVDRRGNVLWRRTAGISGPTGGETYWIIRTSSPSSR